MTIAWRLVPGLGVTTDLLRARARWLTAVELDTALAETLADRLAGTNVEVVNADATNMPFEADRFSGAVCLTMLHHVPSAALQDRLFAEVARVLRPGATLLGSDSIEAPEVRAGHDDDIFVPVDPDQLAVIASLAAGFQQPEVETQATRVPFRTPGSPDSTYSLVRSRRGSAILPRAAGTRTSPPGNGSTRAQSLGGSTDRAAEGLEKVLAGVSIRHAGRSW